MKRDENWKLCRGLSLVLYNGIHILFYSAFYVMFSSMCGCVKTCVLLKKG